MEEGTILFKMTPKRVIPYCGDADSAFRREICVPQSSLRLLSCTVVAEEWKR